MAHSVFYPNICPFECNERIAVLDLVDKKYFRN
jgi:hypothetical protein